MFSELCAQIDGNQKYKQSNQKKRFTEAKTRELIFWIFLVVDLKRKKDVM